MGMQYFFVLLLLIFHTKSIDAADVSNIMLAGEALTGSQTIISNNSIFEMGFFNLQNTSKWYVGIWYAQVTEQSIAWVANREDPLHNASAVFNLTENGSLVISYRGSVIWSTQGGTEASSAVLTDSGNLVVTSARKMSEFIWQSFDTPGNVWLQGMKISPTTKLVSWKSPWDPSPGLFHFQLDPSGIEQEILTLNNSVTYWESGLWNGRIFSNIPAMAENVIYNYSFVDNSTHKYLTYVATDYDALAHFQPMLDTWGKMRVSVLQGNPAKWSMFWSAPGKPCDVFSVCGAYGSCNQDNVQSCNCVHGFKPRDDRAWEFQDWSGGCVRQTPLDCNGSGSNRTTDGFVELSGKSMPRGAVPYMPQSISIQRCDDICLSNCSCTAYAYTTNGTYPICQLWFDDLHNLNDDTSSSVTMFVRVAAADVPKSSSTTMKRSLLRTVLGLVAVSAAIIAIALLLFILYRRRQGLPVNSADFASLGSLTFFRYKELQIATKKFSERLGRGAFGSVFKGTLAGKTPVAVKRLETLSHAHGEKQFRMELSTIGTIQHVKLVRLRGFCSEGSNRLLVYDFMTNGSLNTLLFPKRQGGERELKILDWKSRFGIVLGTARGLLYLHEECRDCIIHCDVKPENILLDSDLCPKVADFGMAKLMGREFSRVLTTMRGTRGYLTPEWISGLPITSKADVYSFGMTVLEILSGRRNVDVDPDDSQFFFPAWAAAEINNGNMMAVVDEDLKGKVDTEEVKRVVMVAGWCIQDEEKARPSMREVVQMLEGVGEVRGVPPIPISLQALA